MKEILLVDGYNIIGAWESLRLLRDNDLQGARDLLIDKMADYQAFTGVRVMIIFDAYIVQGIEKKMKQAKVEVIFTRKNQTADQKIEQLAIHLRKIDTRIHVATSDFTEQWAIFGQGALRKSARELEIEVQSIEQQVRNKIKEKPITTGAFEPRYSKEVTEKLEKLRRGKR
ncbi:NYN domain-containing protein [Ectobacillus sp. sgz5001026]|uniref:NYN domain-containing protein n=1 Tax=Ectobacillus sp. sgz5001026 TaxID=3242473 RepID=UPI0036D2E3FE